MQTGIRKYSRITPHGNAEFESTKERGLPGGQACKHRRLVFVECLFMPCILLKLVSFGPYYHSMRQALLINLL